MRLTESNYISPFYERRTSLLTILYSFMAEFFHDRSVKPQKYNGRKACFT